MSDDPPWGTHYAVAWKQFNIPLIHSYLHDHCWVCRANFANNAYSKRHDHHIIPRAFGGTDGPQVSLCNAHHSLLHDLGDSYISGDEKRRRVLQSKIDTLPPLSRIRLVWLASRVYVSWQATGKDPNKLTLVSVQFSKQELEVLSRLAKRLGLSRNDAIKAALQRLDATTSLR